MNALYDLFHFCLWRWYLRIFIIREQGRMLRIFSWLYWNFSNISSSRSNLKFIKRNKIQNALSGLSLVLFFHTHWKQYLDIFIIRKQACMLRIFPRLYWRFSNISGNRSNLKFRYTTKAEVKKIKILELWILTFY